MTAVAPLQRVVVTGIGAVSSLGITFNETWSNMLKGYSGVRKNVMLDYPMLPCQIAGRIPRIDDEASVSSYDPIGNNNPPNINVFDPKANITRAEACYTDPNVQYALRATSEAMQSSGLEEYLNNNDVDRYRIGVSFATALGGLESEHKSLKLMKSDQWRKVSPYYVVNRIINTPASAIGIRFGLRGPNLANATACSASAHAIQTGFQMIQSGMCDIFVVGGTEAAINPTFIAGLCRCKALTTKYNDSPAKASRPWDRNRSGFVMGEGAACLILESEASAAKRGVSKLYGEIVGVGATADAYNLTGLDPSGAHVQKCMELALQCAKRTTGDDSVLEQLQYINAHATSTDIGDKTELKAILNVLAEPLGDALSDVKISGTKSSTGHVMGAAGALEAALTLNALDTGVAPPTLNLKEVDEFVPGNVNLVANKSQELGDDCQYGMSNSFGFGGTNACVVVKKRKAL